MIGATGANRCHCLMETIAEPAGGDVFKALRSNALHAAVCASNLEHSTPPTTYLRNDLGTTDTDLSYRLGAAQNHAEPGGIFAILNISVASYFHFCVCNNYLNKMKH